MVRLTPNGLSVMSRQRAISLRRSSGVGCVSAVMKPSAPAFATAATSSATPTHCMPPWTIGCSTPASSVNRVLIIERPFPPKAHVLRLAVCLEGKMPPRRRNVYVIAACRTCSGKGWRFRLDRDGCAAKSRHFRALDHKRQYGVERRGRGLRQPSHLLDHRDQRLDFHRPATLEILQHRGLVGADLARAFDAALDVDAEFDLEFFG